jgi:hypothetical protein
VSRRTLNRIIVVSAAAIVSLGLLLSAPAAFAATWKLFDVFSGSTAGQDCRAEGQQGLTDHSWISYSCRTYHSGGTIALWVLN